MVLVFQTNPKLCFGLRTEPQTRHSAERNKCAGSGTTALKYRVLKLRFNKMIPIEPVSSQRIRFLLQILIIVSWILYVTVIWIKNLGLSKGTRLSAKMSVKVTFLHGIALIITRYLPQLFELISS